MWAVFDLTSCKLQLKDSFTEFHVTSASTTPTCVSGIGSEQLLTCYEVCIYNEQFFSLEFFYQSSCCTRPPCVTWLLLISLVSCGVGQEEVQRRSHGCV